MIAYKGFNHDFTCTQGKGVFQYEVGKTYTESNQEIKTRKKGFHATIEPLQVLFWYGQSDAKFAKVELSGNLNDESPIVICASEITILKELTLTDLVKEEIAYFLKNKTGLLAETACYHIKNFHITTKQNTYISAPNINDKLIFIDNNNITVLTVDKDKIKPNIKYNSKGMEEQC